MSAAGHTMTIEHIEQGDESKKTQKTDDKSEHEKELDIEGPYKEQCPGNENIVLAEGNMPKRRKSKKNKGILSKEVNELRRKV